MAWKKRLTVKEKEEYKEKKKEEMGDLFQRIDDGVKAVFQSDVKIHTLLRWKLYADSDAETRCLTCGGLRQMENAWQTGQQG